MKKLLLTLSVFAGMMTANAQGGGYQIPNSNFEGEWQTLEIKKYGSVKHSETTPNSWNSFYAAQGDAKDAAFGFLANQVGTVKQTTGQDGTGSSVTIVSRQNFLKSISNGNLTNGIVNMGKADASAPENYNFTDLDNNTGKCEFIGLPDAVELWCKFVPKDASKGNASVNMILHTDTEYKDPSTIMGAEEATSRIAKAYSEIIPNNNEWKKYTIDFIYNGDLYSTYDGTKYLLASFSTNKTPGSGSDGDELSIDDIKMLYFSELSSLKFDNVEYFKNGETTFEIPFYYDEEKLSYTSNGKGAKIIPSYNKETSTLTLTVQGNNISEEPTNYHEYTVKFKPEPLSVKQYTNSLMVVVSGTATEPTEKTIDLITEADGSTSFALYNFEFSGTPVGDVVITNLNVTQEGNKTIYTGKQDIIVMGQFPATVDVTATVENGKMIANIPIEVMDGVMHVDVTFAPALNIDGQSAVIVENAGLHNVTLSRTFLAGWSTICLPFATTTAAFGEEVKAQTFASADANGLNFTEVTDLEANKPYLIYFPSETTAPIYLSAEVETTTPVSVTFGDFTFCGSYAASMSMSGKYGVADQGDVQKLMLGGEHSTLGATRAYFTKSGDQPAQIRLNLDGNTTAIDEVEQAGTTFTVYTLQGVLVREQATTLNGLPKGIYIVNGKKMIVK